MPTADWTDTESHRDTTQEVIPRILITDLLHLCEVAGGEERERERGKERKIEEMRDGGTNEIEMREQREDREIY